MKIHLWVPGVEPKSGGIEKYSRFLYRALVELLGDANISIFAKNDLSAPHGQESKDTHFVATGRVPLRLRTGTFSALAATHALRHRPDLIISTHLNFTPLASWLKRRLGIPYWLSLHGIEAWGLENPSRRRGLADADRLLPVSTYTRDVVAKEQGISPERFRVLPNAFDPEEFKIGPKPEYLLKRYKLVPEQPVILTVGRLSAAERYKGHDRILRILSEVSRNAAPQSRGEAGLSRNGCEATAGLSNQLSEVSEVKSASVLRPPSSVLRYIVVGDGDDRERLEKLAEELGAREMVIFAGKVPTEELNDHYNLCGVFAMPSTGEGFGIVFLEALACGKPVIAGNKDASRDALLDGELGVLVDPDNLQELTQALVAVLAEVESRKSKVEGNSLAFAIRDSPSALRIPEIIFQPEELRRRVTENFGYQRFKETLAGYLEEFFPQARGDRTEDNNG